MLQKAALVTGASSGIGASIAKVLDSAGFSVILVGRNKERLKDISASLTQPSFVCPTDLEQQIAVTALVSFVFEICEQQKLSLKALVNNAGIIERAPFENISMERWEKDFRVNLLAPVQLVLGLAEKIKQDQTVIVNISSTLGLRPVEETSSYSASKAAMNSWTQSLALEWAPFGVRVVGICPGIVDTPIHAFHEDPESPARKNAGLAHPLKRLGKPEDIAQVVEYLVSEKADWVTGSLWPVDGGISLL